MKTSWGEILKKVREKEKEGFFQSNLHKERYLKKIKTIRKAESFKRRLKWIAELKRKEMEGNLARMKAKGII
mgnify:FL=1